MKWLFSFIVLRTLPLKKSQDGLFKYSDFSSCVQNVCCQQLICLVARSENVFVKKLFKLFCF